MLRGQLCASRMSGFSSRHNVRLWDASRARALPQCPLGLAQLPGSCHSAWWTSASGTSEWPQRADPGETWSFTEGLSLESASVRAEGWKVLVLRALAAPGLVAFWFSVINWGLPACHCEVEQMVCVCVSEGINCILPWCATETKILSVYPLCTMSSSLAQRGGSLSRNSNSKCSIKQTLTVGKPKPQVDSFLSCLVHKFKPKI